MSDWQTYLSQLNNQTQETNVSLTNILNSQIEDANNSITNISRSFQDTLNSLFQQKTQIEQEKEDNKIINQVLVSGAVYQPYISLVAPPGAQNMARYRLQEQTNYRLIQPAQYNTVVTYDPKYETSLNQIQMQIDSIKSQIQQKSQPFLDSITRYTNQINDLNKDIITPNSENTNKSMSASSIAVLVGIGLLFLGSK